MTTPTGITHERFCADIRSAAVAWATARDAITEAETAQLLAAKLVYGAGDGRYHGVCHYSTWKGDAGAAEIVATGAAWKRHARVSACTGRWLRASAMCWRRSLPRSEPRPFGSSVAWSTGASRRPPETGHPRWALADATELWRHETRLHATRTAFRGQTQEVEMADASTLTRYERGLKKMSEVYGVDGGEVVAPLRDLGRYMVEFPYGDIYSRDGLALRDREIATTAMLTALGGREPQLRVHFAAALNVGLTADELEEIIIHTVIFAGFPTAINAMNLLHAVLSERAGGPKNT